MDREAGLYYNISLFGRDLHLQLRPNSRLVAPTATVEWWEESEDRHSQPIGDTDCFYTGQVSNMEDTSVAISNCDGMVGDIFCIPSPSLLSTLSLPLYQVTFMSSLVLSLYPSSSPSQKLLFKTSSLPLHISSLPFLLYHLLPITLFELLLHLHLLNINSFFCSDTGLNTRHAKNKTENKTTKKKHCAKIYIFFIKKGGIWNCRCWRLLLENRESINNVHTRDMYKNSENNNNWTS